MIPKLVFNKHTKAKEYTKEEILAKAETIIEKIKNIEKELEELKNMI